MKKHILFKIIIFKLFFSLSYAMAQYDPTDEMLQLFGGRCLTTGPNAQQALSQANTLEGVAESLKDNPKCQALKTALINFQNSTAELNAYRKNSTIADLEASVTEYELAIAAEKKGNNDATYLASLNLELAKSRIDLISKKNSKDYNAASGKTNAIRSLDVYVKELFRQLGSPSECKERQNLTGLIASQVMALGSNVLSGSGASFLLFGSSLLDSVVKYMANSKITKAVESVSLAKRAESVGCSLEGIAFSYCQSRDISRLVDDQTEANVCIDCLSNKGVKILSNDLSAFIDWASRLNAGTASSTSGQAFEKSNGIMLKTKFDITQVNLQTKVAKNERTYNETAQPEQKMALRVAADDIAKFISGNITDCSNGPCVPGVFSQDFTEDPSCGPHAYLFTNGSIRSCKRTDTSESCLACVLRLGFEAQPFDKMRKSTIDLLGAAKGRIDKEYSRSVEMDPVLVLAKINSPIGVGNKTAEEFLNNTLAYYNERLSDPTSVLNKNPALKQAITESKRKIIDSLAIFKPGGSFTETELAKISTLLIPSNDIYHIGNNLNELVQQEFAEKAKASNAKPDDMKWLIEYSVNETMGQLMSIYGSADNVSSQADLSKSITQKTLSSMGQLFNQSLVDRIVQMKNEGQPRLTALYCIRSLLIPEQNKNTALLEACKGQTYTSKEPGATQELMSFDKIASEPEDEKRICSIYDFSRRVGLIRKQRTRSRNVN